MMNASASPKLSVVVASAASENHRARFLEAVARQSAAGPEVEWLFVDSLGAGVAGAGMKTIPRPPGTPLPEMWGAGIAAAAGGWIAIMETSCPPDKSWTEAALAAIARGGTGIFGGAVEPGSGMNAAARAAYFCEYAQFALPLATGTVGELPGNNLCFRRGLLELAPRFTEGSFWKTYWCGELKRRGVELRCEPTMVVRFGKSYGRREFLRRRYHHGRCYGGMRFRAPDRRRLVRALVAPLLVPLFFARVARAVLPKRRLHGAFLEALPMVLLSLAAWASGEGLGYLRGCGTSCERID